MVKQRSLQVTGLGQLRNRSGAVRAEWEAQGFRSDSHSASSWPAPPGASQTGGTESWIKVTVSHSSPKHSCQLLIPNNIRCLLPLGQESFCFFCRLDNPSVYSTAPSRALSRAVPFLLIGDLRDQSWVLGSQMRASLKGLTASLGLNKPPCPPQSCSICFLQEAFLIAPVTPDLPSP